MTETRGRIEATEATETFASTEATDPIATFGLTEVSETSAAFRAPHAIPSPGAQMTTGCP